MVDWPERLDEALDSAGAAVAADASDPHLCGIQGAVRGEEAAAYERRIPALPAAGC